MLCGWSCSQCCSSQESLTDLKGALCLEEGEFPVYVNLRSDDVLLVDVA